MYVIIIKRFCTFASQKCCPKTVLKRLKTNHDNPKSPQESILDRFWGDIYIYIERERGGQARQVICAHQRTMRVCTRMTKE